MSKTIHLLHRTYVLKLGYKTKKHVHFHGTTPVASSLKSFPVFHNVLINFSYMYPAALFACCSFGEKKPHGRTLELSTLGVKFPSILSDLVLLTYIHTSTHRYFPIYAYILTNIYIHAHVDFRFLFYHVLIM